MTKLEYYGIALMILVLSLLGSYFKGHADGTQAATEKGAAAVLAANVKTDQLNERLLTTTEDHAHAIAARDDQHEKDLDAARTRIKPVLVRIPANQGQLPSGAGTAGAADGAAGGSAQLPMSVERDLGPALLVFARNCQRDRDKVTGWQERERQVQALLGQ